jgi:hypothetical protein
MYKAWWYRQSIPIKIEIEIETETETENETKTLLMLGFDCKERIASLSYDLNIFIIVLTVKKIFRLDLVRY